MVEVGRGRGRDGCWEGMMGEGWLRVQRYKGIDCCPSVPNVLLQRVCKYSSFRQSIVMAAILCLAAWFCTSLCSLHMHIPTRTPMTDSQGVGYRWESRSSHTLRGSRCHVLAAGQIFPASWAAVMPARSWLSLGSSEHGAFPNAE